MAAFVDPKGLEMLLLRKKTLDRSGSNVGNFSTWRGPASNWTGG